MLENSQRRRKKVRTAEKQVYQPLWFDLEKLQEGDDSDVKVSFNQKYWGKKEYEVNYPTLYTWPWVFKSNDLSNFYPVILMVLSLI